MRYTIINYKKYIYLSKISKNKKNPENLVITSKVVGTHRGGPIQGWHV